MQRAAVALCDQDDVWRPHKLERMAAAMQSEPRSGYAFSDADVVDQKLRPLGFRVWETVGFATMVTAKFKGGIRSISCWSVPGLTGATMIVRAEYLTRCLPFPAVSCTTVGSRSFSRRPARTASP